MRRVLDRLAPLILAAALVLAWGAAVRLFELPPYILPGPAAVVAFFPLFSGLATGLRSADRGLEQLFDLY
ncbi:MAG TPA: hypothetical protein VGB49_01500, partial [Caulobacteraceae bacterium]